MIEMKARAELRALTRVASQLFDVSFDELLSDRKWRPLTHFRHLVWLVARERGYRPLTIANTYRADRTTISGGIAAARQHVSLYDWWANRKLELVDAWDEALGHD